MSLLAARVFTEERGTLVSRYSSPGGAHPITVTPDPRDFPDLDYDFSAGLLSPEEAGLIRRWKQVERLDAAQDKFRKAREFCREMREMGGRELTVSISPATQPKLEFEVPTTGQEAPAVSRKRRRKDMEPFAGETQRVPIRLVRSVSGPGSPSTAQGRVSTGGGGPALRDTQTENPASKPSSISLSGVSERLRVPPGDRHVASYSFVSEPGTLDKHISASSVTQSLGAADSRASPAAGSVFGEKSRAAVSYEDIIAEIERQNKEYNEWRFVARWGQ